jgi:Fur family transcriptional regulator, peroxide stress response regulator
LREVRESTGLKMTPQRIAIIDYLRGNTTHPSALDVYKAVSERFPTMSFTTVYNTLQTLRDNGMVIELSIDPEKKRFDPNLEPHHHITCIKCGKLIDVKGRFSLDLSESEKNGFDIVGNRIEFYGLCPTCRPGNSGCKGREKNK